MILFRISTSRACLLSVLPESGLPKDSLPPCRNLSFHVYRVLGARLCSLHSSATLVSGFNACSTIRIFSSVLYLAFLSVMLLPPRQR